MRPKKKGEQGHAAKYITRSQAVRKLQITLKDFRRLCILKGIFPREPKKKFRGPSKTYYLIKDIQYLAHDPMIQKLRDLKIFYRKVKHALGRHNKPKARQLLGTKPQITLDHIIRERYPNFIDAIRDLDDALTLVHLFSKLPTTRILDQVTLEECSSLCREFQYYVAKSNSLKKVFLSIKGIYYQAEIMGQAVTWVVPYQFSQHIPRDVDYRVMQTFVQFYKVLIGFINYKLYSSLNITYPPRVEKHENFMGAGILAINADPKDAAQGQPKQTKPKQKKQSQDTEALKRKVASLGAELASKHESDDEESDEEQTEANETADTELEKITRDLYNIDESVPLPSGGQKKLFSGIYFFLGRETPLESLIFVIKSFDGEVGWESPGSHYKVDDQRIKYQIIDRNTHTKVYLNRQYVQPQWVYDSVNTGVLLPTKDYGIGATVPPHLSPFVDDEREGYTPARRRELNRLMGLEQQEIEEEDKEDDDLDELEEEESKLLYGEDKEQDDEGDDDEDEEDDGKSDSEDEDEGDENAAPAPEKKSKSPSQPQKQAPPKRKADEEKQLAKMVMTKKQKDLYNRLKRNDRQKDKQAKKLQQRHDEIQAAKKSKKTKTSA